MESQNTRRDTISNPFVYLKPDQDEIIPSNLENRFDVIISQILAVFLAIPFHSVDMDRQSDSERNVTHNFLIYSTVFGRLKVS